MRLAILSDIHDHVTELRSALAELASAGGADRLLCCGDLCAPFMVEELVDGFAGPVHVVFGNNDGDRYRITRAAAGRHDLVCYGHSHEWEQGRHGDTLALNPGEIMGRLGPPTFAVYDTEHDRVTHHELDS